MTTLPTSEDAPRAHAVTATRSWPVSELVVAMMTSVLLHIAWFTFFLATVGLHPEPPWVVFAADPGADVPAAAVVEAALAANNVFWCGKFKEHRSKGYPFPCVWPQ